jgi:hypothetical protein
VRSQLVELEEATVATEMVMAAMAWLLAVRGAAARLITRRKLLK